MKITVLTGSPRRNGNSAYLAEQFIKGAQEKGHEIFRFDCAFKQVEPCRACNRCGMDGPCIIKDDFNELRPHLIESDMVVFATPMYYFGISAQMKRVIDRFYAINGQIKGHYKKVAFLMTYADTEKKEAEPMLLHYHTLMEYLGWESVGEVVASGVWTAGSIRNTHYGEQGLSIREKYITNTIMKKYIIAIVFFPEPKTTRDDNLCYPCYDADTSTAKSSCRGCTQCRGYSRRTA